MSYSNTTVKNSILEPSKTRQGWEAETTGFLRDLFRPGDVFELRAFKVIDNSSKPEFARTVAGYYDYGHIANFAAKAQQLTRKASGIYVTANPVPGELLTRSNNRTQKAEKDGLTKNEEIMSRRSLVFDVDPVRFMANGKPFTGSMATPEEQKRAFEVQENLLNRLTAFGFPEPYRISSGNGYYLWYLIDLPANDGGIVQRAIGRADGLCSNQYAGVDTVCANAGRVFRVPGTLNRKGDELGERKHRWASIVSHPERWETVPQALLEDFGRATAQVAVPSVQPVAAPVATSICQGMGVEGESGNPVKEDEPHRYWRMQDTWAYMLTQKDSIQGEHGSNALMSVCNTALIKFGNRFDDSWKLISRWNEEHAIPKWSDEERDKKLHDVDKNTTDRRGEKFIRTDFPPIPTTPLSGPFQPPPPQSVSVSYDNLKLRASEHVKRNDLYALLHDDKFLIDLLSIEHSEPADYASIMLIIKTINCCTDKAVKPTFDKHRAGIRKATKERQTASSKALEEEFEFTDIGNSKRLVNRYQHVIRYCSHYCNWIFYNGMRWVIDSEGKVQEFAKDIAESIAGECPCNADEETAKAFKDWCNCSQSLHGVQAMMKLAQSDPRVVISSDKFNKWPMLLNVANGTINLETGELRPHCKDDYLTKLMTINYKPDAKCPKWDEFINKVTCGDVELAKYLQRALGYSLTGKVGEHCLFFLHGGGSNGKSTLLLAVQGIMGDYAKTGRSELIIDQGRYHEHPTELTDLEGARLVVIAETEEQVFLSSEQVKRIVGNEKIKARKMRQDFYEFDPTHKIFLVSNHRPIIPETDDGIWRRVKLIPFEFKFNEHNTVKDYHDIFINEEREGILAWLVVGCLEWKREGLNPPQSVIDATNDYRNGIDICQRFITEICIIDDYAKCKISVLYEAYSEWCKAENIKARSKNSFSADLDKRGFKPQHANDGNYRLGLALANSPEVEAARKWLFSEMGYCDQFAESEILQRGKSDGHSANDLRRAAKLLNVIIIYGKWQMPAPSDTYTSSVDLSKL